MNNKSGNWKFIANSLGNIENYYGIKLQPRVVNSVSTELLNGLIENAWLRLPHVIHAKCVDGKVYEGVLTLDRIVELIATRSKCPSKEMTAELWSNLLADYGEPVYTYCFENRTFHPELMPEVGCYLMENKCSANMYDILIGNSILRYKMSAESYKVFDLFVKKEKSITAKKEVFTEQLSGISDNVSNKHFAWVYCNHMVGDKNYNATNIDTKLATLCENKSFDHDICLSDLLYRVHKGISIDDAIQLGKQDSIKFGFKCEFSEHTIDIGHCTYTLGGLNYNLAMYIKYLWINR